MRDGIGFDDDFGGGAEFGLEEFVASKFGEGDVGGDFVAVGAEEAVDDEHGGNGEGGGKRIAITAVDDAADGGATEAVFADFVVAVEVRVDADEAIVVEGLDDGDTLLCGCPVDGGRDEGEGVVAVDDVGFFVLD